jgi:short-subunit dehydrogenase
MKPRAGASEIDLALCHVVVTGASRGIGRQIAVELAGRGSRVTVVARSEATLRSVATRIGANAMPADLTNPAELEGLIDLIEVNAGPVDVLINNAALITHSPFWELEPEELRDSIDLNLTAPMELTRQTLPGMLDRGRGMVVNISSFASLAVMPTIATYCAGKAGLAHFTAALQRELRGSPVRTMIVQLGEVAGTDLVESARKSKPIAAASRRLDRLGVLPNLSLETVGAGVADAIAAGRQSLVLPSRLAPLHHHRDLPNRMNDLLLAGADSKLDFP